jgi:cytochrome c553
MDSMENQETKQFSRLPIIIVVLLIVVFSVIFLLEFAALSESTAGVIPEDQLTQDSYMNIVVPLIASAEPDNAPDLLVVNGCAACHQNNLGPSFDDLPAAASERKPPLQAPAYIYESILYPGAHVVEGPYQNNMPRNYMDRLGEEDLADIIAWMLADPAQRASLE